MTTGAEGGALSEAWDRVTGFPYWHKPTYDCDYSMRLVGLIAQEIPAWREITAQAADALVSRFPQHAAWYDWVEEKGLDPNKDKYPLFYYQHLIPPGFAGVYNAPGYCGNGFSSMTDELFASVFVAPRRKPLATTPYYPKHDGAVELTRRPSTAPARAGIYNPDPIYGNGSSNMMYRGYFAHSLMMAHHHQRRQQVPGSADDGLQQGHPVHVQLRADHLAMMDEQHRGGLDENGSPLHLRHRLRSREGLPRLRVGRWPGRQPVRQALRHQLPPGLRQLAGVGQGRRHRRRRRPRGARSAGVPRTSTGTSRTP